MRKPHNGNSRKKQKVNTNRLQNKKGQEHFYNQEFFKEDNFFVKMVDPIGTKRYY